jgi:hypothetical protein
MMRLKEFLAAINRRLTRWKTERLIQRELAKEIRRQQRLRTWSGWLIGWLQTKRSDQTHAEAAGGLLKRKLRLIWSATGSARCRWMQRAILASLKLSLWAARLRLHQRM